MPKKITLLVPCYNEEENLEELRERVSEEIAGLPYIFEFLFVDDGSKDDTKSVIKALAEKDERVSYIFLSRNFGKESAMMAGINHLDTDAVIFLDADLQDPPSVIPKLIHEWEKGFCDVYAKRIKREGDSALKRFTAWAFYKFLRRIADIPVNENVGDFRLLDRKCIDALKDCRENQRYTKGLFEFIGFSKKEVQFVREKRFKGETKFSYGKLVKLAIQGILSFSSKPLRIASNIGFLAILISLVFAAYVVVQKLFWGVPIIGYPSLITLIVFLSGVQLFTIGILSEYVSVIFNEIKARPPYIVDERSA